MPLCFHLARPLILISKSTDLQKSIALRISHKSFISKSEDSSVKLEDFYVSFLQRCVQTSDSRHGSAIHAKFLKGFLPFSLFFHNHVLNLYVKCGRLSYGLQLFDEMPERNVVSWSAIIAGFVQHGRPNEALSLFGRMHCDGTIMPNEFTLVSALHACSLTQRLICSYQIYAFIVRLGYGSNVFLMNAFLTALIRHEKLLEALEVFESCLSKDTVSWNAMMAGYLQLAYFELPKFWRRMNLESVKPDNFTFASILTGLAALSEFRLGLQVHGQLVKSGYGNDICVGNSLCDMYIKNQKLLDGFKAFDEMSSSDVCSWTQMASGCLQCGEPMKALEVIYEMKNVGVRLNKFTLATALNSCANLASIEEGKKFHGLRIKLGTDVDVCVDNALLDMYAKCGCMTSANVVFRSMDERSVVSWTTMIMGFAHNGQTKEALQIFDEMRKGEAEPNHITFICVLNACSQGGFIDEAWKYFSSMSADHGIAPSEDHYVCMVNLLGRAGCIKEAEDLILQMPFQPGSLVWQTLLGACLVHGDIETGKRAAEHALNLDRNDPSTYILLSNMFAGGNNWDGVGSLRELMETRDVKKVPGSSWMSNMRRTID
ncbi:pentatricopeptide repeat-containing protein At2g13600-like isoform X1 [Cucumis melo]|uniref:Pentatricopeptide repeat-containing protein At2g13600-like isoform X1 n=1 Tax=Cucumis melo TaxID=3656 RepID=A0A1S4E4G2_CUCME|nr:pentatricopeptide repeat-containing protein At2g13600-like isoform X1 [Cucumis melo]XP_016903114.2 pentatricopeptide repeat-containing protein At2g13600-like isoform X1 [Cucumis melo]